jgi:hypothetical protein
MVLDALAKLVGIPDIKNMVKLEEFVRRLNSWKETTSTLLITKHHLGHYKCLLQLIVMEKEDSEPDKTIEHAKWILQAHYKLVQCTTKHGVLLRQWRKVVNSMIQKDHGNPQIHWLQVIGIYIWQTAICCSVYVGLISYFHRVKTLDYSTKTATEAIPGDQQLTL